MSKPEIDVVRQIDCLEGMKEIPDASVDMIFCDLPYSVTARNSWDSMIPPALLWPEYERIIKRHGVILLFGQDKFTAEMMLSNRRLHRYNIIWEKTTPTGFLNANRMPLRIHEDIMVFYKALPVYHPQKTDGHSPVHSYTKRTSDGTDERLAVCDGQAEILPPSHAEACGLVPIRDSDIQQSGRFGSGQLLRKRLNSGCRENGRPSLHRHGQWILRERRRVLWRFLGADCHRKAEIR